MLTLKWIKNLANECAGMRFPLISHKTSRLGQDVLRHIESAERNVDTGKHNGKIFVHCVKRVRMVPPVLNGAHQQIAKRPESPSRIGMDEEIPKANRDSGHDDHFGIRSYHYASGKHNAFEHHISNAFRRVKSWARGPVNLFGCMMNGVELPSVF